MHDVQAKFACERISKDASVTSGYFNADKDFAMLKGQHVGRSPCMEELPMQRRHSTIRDEPNENLAQPGQVSRSPLSQLQTRSHRFRCESFKIANANRNSPLQIANRDLGNCCRLEIAPHRIRQL
jgi:hypothetical protein